MKETILHFSSRLGTRQAVEKALTRGADAQTLFDVLVNHPHPGLTVDAVLEQYRNSKCSSE